MKICAYNWFLFYFYISNIYSTKNLYSYINVAKGSKSILGKNNGFIVRIYSFRPDEIDFWHKLKSIIYIYQTTGFRKWNNAEKYQLQKYKHYFFFSYLFIYTIVYFDKLKCMNKLYYLIKFHKIFITIFLEFEIHVLENTLP